MSGGVNSVLTKPFEAVLIWHVKSDRDIVDKLLQEKGIGNPVIKEIKYVQNLDLESLRGKRVISIHTTAIESADMAISPYQLLRANCLFVGAVFLLYVNPQSEQPKFRGYKELKGCLYGEPGVFEKWSGLPKTIPDQKEPKQQPQIPHDPTKSTPSYVARVTPFFALAAVFIVAAIFAAKRGYFSYVFSSK